VTLRAGRSVSSGLDHAIARLLVIGTLGSVALLAIGVVLMSAARVAPLAGAPPFQPALILDDVLHLRPAGFLWLGLIAAIATPTARVMASLIGYARGGERSMAVVAAVILGVLLLSVWLGLGIEG
jgi:uncharacterized membrane protein